MQMTKIETDALYLSLKASEYISFRKKKRKKNSGNTIDESTLKLSEKSLVIFPVTAVFFEISISKKFPVTLTNNPNNGISKAPLKKIAKSLAARRYNKNTLSIHFEVTPVMSVSPR